MPAQVVIKKRSEIQDKRFLFDWLPSLSLRLWAFAFTALILNSNAVEARELEYIRKFRIAS